MLATTSLLTSVGSAWYSACIRSGGLPALAAVSSLVTCASPWAWLLTVTWISGWALFHLATTWSRLGTHDQYVSSTLPPEPLPAPLPPPELQATSRSAPMTSARVLPPDLDPMA